LRSGDSICLAVPERNGVGYHEEKIKRKRPRTGVENARGGKRETDGGDTGYRKRIRGLLNQTTKKKKKTKPPKPKEKLCWGDSKPTKRKYNRGEGAKSGEAKDKRGKKTVRSK